MKLGRQSTEKIYQEPGTTDLVSRKRDILRGQMRRNKLAQRKKYCIHEKKLESFPFFNDANIELPLGATINRRWLDDNFWCVTLGRLHRVADTANEPEKAADQERPGRSLLASRWTSTSRLSYGETVRRRTVVVYQFLLHNVIAILLDANDRSVNSHRR